jgi:hypothetical protein
MRIAILLIAVLIITLAVFGLISPDTVMAPRREYVVNAYGMYVVAAVRLTLGVLLIRFAPASRVPKILRAFGILVCLQALVQAVGATFIPLDRARDARVAGQLSRAPARRRADGVSIGGFLVFAATRAAARSST